MAVHRILLFTIGTLSLFASKSLSWTWISQYSKDKKVKCEPITIPFCKGLHYNKTIFPNHFNHETQSEAALEVNQFSPLISVKCSADLQLFLCTLYAPVCTNFNKLLSPCRTLCKRAKRGCIGLMRKFGFTWPERMACKKFPKKKKKSLCIDIKHKKDPRKKKKKKGERNGNKKQRKRSGSKKVG